MVSLLWLGVGVHEWRYLLLTLAVLPASRPLVFDSGQSRWLDEIATARRSMLPRNLANQPHVYHITLLTARHQINVSPLGTDLCYFLGLNTGAEVCANLASNQRPRTPSLGSRQFERPPSSDIFQSAKSLTLATHVDFYTETKFMVSTEIKDV